MKQKVLLMCPVNQDYNKEDNNINKFNIISINLF